MDKRCGQNNMKGLAYSEWTISYHCSFKVLTISTHSRSSRAVFDSYLRTNSRPLSATLVASVYSSSCKWTRAVIMFASSESGSAEKAS